MAFDSAGEILTRRFTHPLWKFTEWLDGDAKIMTEAAKTMDDFVYAIIDKKENALEEDDGDLLSAYMLLRDEQGEPLSRQFLRYALSSSLKLL